ncbi:MAG TPA: organic hydroperoxide resistance protein [Burkholderiaceae bacterium]|nr:organic hydroperoxide resistance protein [Burkholderiaceae bacterium]
MPLNILYTTHAIAVGGRNGHTRNHDGLIDLDLSVPKSMGGPGKPNTTTPEDLFAAGYAACFGSACDFVAKSMLKLNPTKITVDCAVGIGRDEAQRFGLKVDLTATLEGLTQADADRLVAEAHKVCPYSNATRNNVEVTLKARAA